MANQHFSRRRFFFFGSLLAGAVPTGGSGTFKSLRALGYKPYYDKLNVAALGNQVSRICAKPGGKYPVKWRRCPSALNIK